ncbi:MAG: hypothetical protein FJW39_09850 [Acidobacteria bacterium]|nr:hypothetical protein [Acidobacteriota bacterium]
MTSLFAFFQAKKAAPAPATGEAAAIAAIEKAGGAVRKIAQNDERVEVDFHLQGAAVKDEHVKPVAGLKKVMRVHLGRTPVTDAALAFLKPLAADLTELHLEGTKITDAGLANLKGLTNLVYLNLYDTAVTDAGLKQLTGLKALKNIYVWQTKVTKEGADQFKAALPGVNVDRGWELPPPEPKKEEPKKEEKKQ